MQHLQRRVRLPPLIIDGEPKSFLAMTTRDLQLCVTLALKASYGFPLTTSGFRFRAHTRPVWWPDDLEWSIRYMDAIFPVQDRSKYIRDLLRLCYRHYHQEETLFLFDVNPGELPQWRTVQDSNGWALISLDSGAELWRFASQYQVTTLCAFEARLKEEHRQQEGPRSSLLRHQSATTPTATRSRLFISPQKDETLSERRIIDAKSPVTCLETAFGGQQDGPIVKATALECRNCKQQFLLDVDLASHLVSCTANTRCQMEKNAQLFRLGLVPKSASSMLSAERAGRTLVCDRKLRRFGGSFRGEITSELGRLLLSTDMSDQKLESLALKAERNCMGAMLSCSRRLRQAVTSEGNASVQNVYRRIPGVKNNNVLLKLNGPERRFAAKQQKDLKRMVKEWCVPVRVVVQRLTDEQLVKYAPVSLLSDSEAGVKELRVVIERLTAEEEAALLVGTYFGGSVPAKGISATGKSDRRSTTPAITTTRVPSSSPSPQSQRACCSQKSPMNNTLTPRMSPRTQLIIPGSNATNTQLRLVETVGFPLFPSHKPSRPAALVAPLNYHRSSPRPFKIPVSSNQTDLSTLFFCQLCGFEQLLEVNARSNIQQHVVELHKDRSIVYKRMRHTVAGVRLLVVEAVQDECIGAIYRK